MPPAQRPKTTAMHIAMPVAALFGAIASPGAEAAVYQQYLQGSCSGERCTVDFPKIPAGKTLRATMASCYFRIANEVGAPDNHIDALSVSVLDSKGSFAAGEILPIVPMGTHLLSASVTETVYAVNSGILLTAAGGQQLQTNAIVRDGTPFQMSCHVSGTLTP